jgi:hypothetical protein
MGCADSFWVMCVWSTAKPLLWIAINNMSALMWHQLLPAALSQPGKYTLCLFGFKLFGFKLRCTFVGSN